MLYDERVVLLWDKRIPVPSNLQRATDSGSNLHWLENYGCEVFDVGLTCDPEFFLLEAEVFWQGGFGSNQPGGYIGKFFTGAATEVGKAEGVIFHVAW